MFYYFKSNKLYTYGEIVSKCRIFVIRIIEMSLYFYRILYLYSSKSIIEKIKILVDKNTKEKRHKCYTVPQICLELLQMINCQNKIQQ